MAMERGFSFDDLMDGIHKLTSAGFPRNDSEALFQDFIRRIPSSNNLSASEGLNYLDPVQQAQLQQSVQQIQQQAQQQTGAEALRANSTDLQEVGGLEVKNFPRVASLDYLQHLVQQSAASQSMKASTPAPETTTAEVQSGPTAATPTQPAVSAPELPPLPMVTTQPAAPPLSSAPSHPHALAAALQLGQLTGLQLRPVAQEPNESSGNGKAEVRRARRMLSNRESARRSRRRKQEHLCTMEEQLATCSEEKQRLEEQHKKVLGELENARTENARLRRELEDCQKQLRAVGPDGGRRADGSAGGEPGAKRLCNGHRDTKPRGGAKPSAVHPKKEPDL